MLKYFLLFTVLFALLISVSAVKPFRANVKGANLKGIYVEGLGNVEDDGLNPDDDDDGEQDDIVFAYDDDYYFDDDDLARVDDDDDGVDDDNDIVEFGSNWPTSDFTKLFSDKSWTINSSPALAIPIAMLCIALVGLF